MSEQTAYTLAQVARELKIPYATIRSYVYQKVPPLIRVVHLPRLGTRRRVMVTRSELERLKEIAFSDDGKESA